MKAESPQFRLCSYGPPDDDPNEYNWLIEISHNGGETYVPLAEGISNYAAAKRLVEAPAALEAAQRENERLRGAVLHVIEVDRLIGGVPQQEATELRVRQDDSALVQDLLEGLGVDAHAGMPRVVADPTMPEGEISFRIDGKEVGRIVNVGVERINPEDDG